MKLIATVAILAASIAPASAEMYCSEESGKIDFQGESLTFVGSEDSEFCDLGLAGDGTYFCANTDDYVLHLNTEGKEPHIILGFVDSGDDGIYYRPCG